VLAFNNSGKDVLKYFPRSLINDGEPPDVEPDEPCPFPQQIISWQYPLLNNRLNFKSPFLQPIYNLFKSLTSGPQIVSCWNPLMWHLQGEESR